MSQTLMAFDEIGAKRTGPHKGGKKQKYLLDEPGRRLILARYDGTSTTITALAKRLMVPRWKIKQWGCQLGLARQKERPWTQAEMEYLENNLCRSSIKALARHLGRTQTAVKLKAKRLGVRKTQEGYTMRGLCEGLGVDHHTVEHWLAKGWLKGARRHTERPLDIWYFSEKAIRDFVKAHPEAIDPRRADWLWLVDILVGGIGAPVRPDEKEVDA